jgi:hypothetical protein
MSRLPLLARSAALSLRPGPNPLAFPGLVVAAAAAALGFAVLTAPKLYALSVIGVTASALLSSSIARAGDQGDPGHRATKTSSTRSLPAARDVGPVDDARVEDLRRRLSALAYSTQASRS